MVTDRLPVTRPKLDEAVQETAEDEGVPVDAIREEK